MITHTDVPSANFQPSKDLVMVKPRELPRGEVLEDGIIVEVDQNTSVVDRPTLGKVIAVGSDFDENIVGNTIIWVEQDGIDVELEDGLFLMLQEKSILGTIKGVQDEL